MASQLSNDALMRLARLGAAARLQQIEEERRAILRAFPGLGATRVTIIAASGDAPIDEPKKKVRTRRKMTAAEKKAASERMKKYWAAKKQR